MDYYSRFVTNTVIVPVVLLALVTATYAMDKTPAPSLESLSPSELTRRNQERRTRQKSDYYFAFFLSCECRLNRTNCYVTLLFKTQRARLPCADPTITQSFFAHFNCRALSDDLAVLDKDYSVQCSGTQWWALAVFSALGILVVSIGFPVGMFIWYSLSAMSAI